MATVGIGLVVQTGVRLNGIERDPNLYEQNKILLKKMIQRTSTFCPRISSTPFSTALNAVYVFTCVCVLAITQPAFLRVKIIWGSVKWK